MPSILLKERYMSLKLAPIAAVPHFVSNFRLTLTRSIDGQIDHAFDKRTFAVSIYHPVTVLNEFVDTPESIANVCRLFSEFFGSVDAAMMGMVHYPITSPLRDAVKAREEFAEYLRQHAVVYSIADIVRLASDLHCQYILTVKE